MFCTVGLGLAACSELIMSAEGEQPTVSNQRLSCFFGQNVRPGTPMDNKDGLRQHVFKYVLRAA